MRKDAISHTQPQKTDHLVNASSTQSKHCNMIPSGPALCAILLQLFYALLRSGDLHRAEGLKLLEVLA